MPEEVIHKTVNGKFRVVIERSAVKGIDGFKVEANGDLFDEVIQNAEALYKCAIIITKENANI